MNRTFAPTCLFLLLFSLGALAPRVAHATPGKDACNGMLELDPQTGGVGVYGPGTWCLDHDMVVTLDESVFSMVTVHMSDITIDCRGYLLEYQGTADFSYGVVDADAAERVTVRNCHFRGFTTAVALSGEGYVIEDNVIDAGATSTFGDGTAINGYNIGTIRDNRIHAAIARGIYAQGASRVTGNVIDGIYDAQYQRAVGIQVDSAEAAEISGNTIRGMAPAVEFAQHVGIMVNSDTGGARTRVDDNVLVGDGVSGSIGVMCSANARVVDNVLAGFLAPTAYCDDVADNDESL